jgi:hypothetical protein
MAAKQRFCCTNHRVYAGRANADKPKKPTAAAAPSAHAAPVTEAPIDWASLSGTAAQKIEAARRRIRRELEAEFEPRVQAEVERRIGGAFDRAREMYDSIERFESTERRGVITEAEYKLIRSCLHPDSRNSASEEKFNKAFRVFNEAKIKFIPPRRPSDLPSLDELVKRRAEKQYQDHLKRQARKKP